MEYSENFILRTTAHDESLLHYLLCQIDQKSDGCAGQDVTGGNLLEAGEGLGYLY